MDAIEQLREIVVQLRGPEGCPWDKEQTFESLIPHIIEEAYELVDAIQSGIPTAIQEELGDVLLHVVMLSEMASELQKFNLQDVGTMVNEKMIRRHPHVFGDTKISSIDELWQNWEAIKATEKPQGPFESIPKSLPGLIKASKILKRAGRIGHSLPSQADSIAELERFLNFLKSMPNLTTGPTEAVGSALFAFVNICRLHAIDPEQALNVACETYIKQVS